MDKKNNTGDYNSGNYNSGNCNSGNYNSGYCNSGDCNSGNYNSGNYNSGNCNSGNYNSGYCNSGYCNSGDCNSGNYNSGYCNSGDCNSGWFNTDEPTMRFFNKDSDIKYSDFNIKVYPDLKITAWVDKSDLSEDEITSEVEQMGGILKTLTYKEAWKEYWGRASEDDKKWFQSLPNFCPKIFKEITGIDVNINVSLTDEELIAELEKRGRVKEGKVIN